MSRGIFVTGTNTGVGKTVITRALARAAKKRGIDIAALKPVESGVVLQGDTDAARLIAAAGRADRLEEVCVYAFRAAVSPHLAARLENSVVDPECLVRFLVEWTAQIDLVIAEGAGGLLVPLADNVTYADIISRAGFRLLIVAPNGLGAINATLLTIEAARHRNIDIAGIVLNGTPKGDFGNAAAVSAYGRVPVLGEFPTSDIEDDDRLADLAEDCLDLKQLFSAFQHT